MLLLAPLVWGDENAQALQLASVSAQVMPLQSEQPLFEKRSDWVMPIASITKVMTAIVVLDSKADMDERLKVEKRHFPAAANAYSRIRPGSAAKRSDLLKIALMSSENYAAYLLAWHHPGGYDAFIEAMNAKARELGMLNTRFVDSSGLSEKNVSTASDLMRMVKAAYQYPEIREASTSSKHDVWFTQPGYSLYYANTNPLVRSSRWDVSLSKTGYLIDAGRCLVMVTDIDGEEVGMVFLDSFGKRTPLGDAGRTKRWITSGTASQIAGAAQRYEIEKAGSIKAQLVNSEKEATISAGAASVQ
ncbi:D-alanyl-D-alanine endopeptidase [Gilvimarinus sp. DA14]|uniref:D-alanyl-D-alanine endopeptidase n=1 Tax=Gilvimarinus sp. DA14 TaxID=2956798 RepID=UPI0020B7BD7F|nr:D-alanyl-D-alanine endopeptidase [Gilvimarinus sp. DA14]UTF59915.1 D-alanyl-D-alanine endopeptidase [Gilvimarinus sp. DA14]